MDSFLASKGIHLPSKGEQLSSGDFDDSLMETNLEDRLKRLEDMLNKNKDTSDTIKISPLPPPSIMSSNSPMTALRRAEALMANIDIDSPLVSPTSSLRANIESIDSPLLINKFNVLGTAKTIKGTTSSVDAAEINAWSGVNKILMQYGFTSVPLPSTGHSNIATIHAVSERLIDILSQYNKRGGVINELVMNANKSKVKERDSSQRDVKESAVNVLQTREYLTAQARINDLQEQLSEANKNGAELIAKLRKEVSALRGKLVQSEHRVKAKEVLIEKMQDKLKEEVMREKVIQKKDREMFENLMSREPRSGTAHDNKMMDIVHLFQQKLESTESELKYLRKEVQRQNEVLRSRLLFK